MWLDGNISSTEHDTRPNNGRRTWNRGIQTRTQIYEKDSRRGTDMVRQRGELRIAETLLRERKGVRLRPRKG